MAYSSAGQSCYIHPQDSPASRTVLLDMIIMGIARYKNYYKGGYFHIFNRGNGKQDIFLEDKDYEFYLRKLEEYSEKYNITILCYCLMPNHIHLLVRQETDIPTHRLVSSLHTSYGKYFNEKYDKVGHLFQDRFKQKDIHNDKYLVDLSCYIHLNPVEAGLAEKAEDYQWSSYINYIDEIGFRESQDSPGSRTVLGLCDKSLILDIFSKDVSEYKRFVKDALNFKEDTRWNKIEDFIME